VRPRVKEPRRKGRPVDLFVKGVISRDIVLLGPFKTTAAAETRALEKLGATIVAGKKNVLSLIAEAWISDCTTGFPVPGPRFKVNEEWTKILCKRSQDGRWEEMP